MLEIVNSDFSRIRDVIFNLFVKLTTKSYFNKIFYCFEWSVREFAISQSNITEIKIAISTRDPTSGMTDYRPAVFSYGTEARPLDCQPGIRFICERDIFECNITTQRNSISPYIPIF